MQLMATRLRKKGYSVSVFSRHYPLTGAKSAATDLHQHLEAIDSEELHLVAHSFGGIVLLTLFKKLGLADGSAQLPERVRSCLFIASPLAGAQLAVHLVQGSAGFFWKPILGKSLEQGLARGMAEADIPENSGFITGTSKSLLSKLLQRDTASGDGLVRFSETRAAGRPSTHHVSLPLTHASLLFSRRCCTRIDEFICQGRFSADSSDPDEQGN